MGRSGLEDLSRRPHSCPWQTPEFVAEELVKTREKHPYWGPKKLLDIMERRHRGWDLPSVATAAHILAERGLVRERRRHRRAHPGCAKSVAEGPNDIWGSDYKGQFRMGNGQYCFPQTVSDLYARFLLGCDGHPQVSGELTKAHFGGSADTRDILRAVDSGLTILKGIRALPHEKYVVYEPNIPLYSDSLCQNLRAGVTGIMLEAEAPGSKETVRRIYPTTRDYYQKGQAVAWEWNGTQRWGETWYCDPDTEEGKQAWGESAEFVGRPLERV